MIKKIAVFFAALFMVVVLYQFLFATRSRLCKLSPVFSIDTVRHGKFAEHIPANGALTFDSISKRAHVKMQIDQLYLSRVKAGLKATSIVNSREYFLTVTSVDTVVTQGRFEAILAFDGDVPQPRQQDSRMRLLLYLTSAIDATIIPVGGFYRDTGGSFVYVVDRDDLVVKRNVVLGRKNSDYFEVLNGLTPGERVITSSYEWFDNKDTVNLSQIKELYE